GRAVRGGGRRFARLERLAGGRRGGGHGVRDIVIVGFDACLTSARGPAALISAASEQIVQQPAVETGAAGVGRIAGRLNRRRWRWRRALGCRCWRVAAEQSGHYASGRWAGQGYDWNALMRGAHE